jgi:hypothetical protein
VGRASVPAPLVAQVFNLCTRTGKMPVPPKTFRNSFGFQIFNQQVMGFGVCQHHDSG